MRKLFLAIGLALILALVAAWRLPTTVHVEREFAAPVARVWAVFTDPAMMRKWWGPKGYTAPVIDSDLRAGGAYLFAMRSSGGETYWNIGRYREVLRESRIVATMAFADGHGRKIRGRDVTVPGRWPDETTLTVEFSVRNGRTRVAVHEQGVTLVMSLFAGLGWEQQFDKFEALL